MTRTRSWVVMVLVGACVAATIYWVVAHALYKRMLTAAFHSNRLERTEAGFVRAIEQGDAKAVQLFLADGFSANERVYKDEGPVLFGCARTGRLSVLKVLVDAGANVHAADLAGYQAIHVGASHAQPDIVRELLKAGADPNAPGRPTLDDGAFVPLYSAVISFSAIAGPEPGEAKRRLETAEILLDHGANVNAYHPIRGDGPLHRAAGSGLENVVSLLLQRGAEVEHEDSKGDTPLIVAAALGRTGAVSALLAGGAQVDHGTRRGSALLLASQLGRVEVLRVLLRARANPRIANAAGKSALDVARSRTILHLLQNAEAFTHP